MRKELIALGRRARELRKQSGPSEKAIELERGHAPTVWVHEMLEYAKDLPGGAVVRHLVGAMLERRFKSIAIADLSVQERDSQTPVKGDFAVRKVVYHVTMSLSRETMRECAESARAGLQPVLLIPEEQREKAGFLAEDMRVDKALAIFSIEQFVGLGIIEMAAAEGKYPFTILKEIVRIYNRRSVDSGVCRLLLVRAKRCK